MASRAARPQQIIGSSFVDQSWGGGTGRRSKRKQASQHLRAACGHKALQQTIRECKKLLPVGVSAT